MRLDRAGDLALGALTGKTGPPLCVPAKNEPMAQRMSHLGLPRDPRATTYLLGFVVSAVVTILIVRTALAATGYPQVGGNGLHIAHAIWGGLLLALAIVLSMSFVGQVIRPFVAIVAGIGFGLFLDEIGKFVTSTNNYFFRPAIAIMYAIVVLITLLVHWLHGRKAPQPSEFLAAALAEATAATDGGLSDRRRERALELIALAGDQPGAIQADALVRAMPSSRKELGDPLIALRRRAQRIGTPIVALRSLRRITIGLLVLVSFIELLTILTIAVLDLFVPGTLRHDDPNVASIGGAVSGSASALCVIRGLWCYRRDKATAFSWFQRALLIDLLVTQVFVVASDQFSALPPIVVDLVMLGVLSAARTQYEAIAAAQTPVLTAAEPPAPERLVVPG
jgi:hypothetical protein